MFRVKYRVFNICIIILIIFIFICFSFIKSKISEATESIKSVQIVDDSEITLNNSNDNVLKLLSSLMEKENLEVTDISNYDEKIEISVKCKGNDLEIKKILSDINDMNMKSVIDQISISGEECTFKINVKR